MKKFVVTALLLCIVFFMSGCAGVEEDTLVADQVSDNKELTDTDESETDETASDESTGTSEASDVQETVTEPVTDTAAENEKEENDCE